MINTSKKVVLVTGVFDLLHQEHVFFLQQAKQQGEYLVVGIESDVRVRALKGEGRPVNSEVARKQKILDLGLADEVIILPQKFSDQSDHRLFLKRIRPQLLAVSSHSPHLAEKQHLMQEIGGRVVIVHQHNPQVSSSLLVQQAARNQNE